MMQNQNDHGVYFRGWLIDRMVSEEIIDLKATPYFYNQPDHPHFTARNAAPEQALNPKEIIPADLSDLAVLNVEVIDRRSSDWGITTELSIQHLSPIHYQPIQITPEYAAAFGMVLVQPHEAIYIQSDQLQLSYCQYEYGCYAGYNNPYLDPARGNEGRTRYPSICTDLEGHNFPHLFVSCDPHVDLVTSVGVYNTKKRTLVVADLWIPRGCALYIPPQDIQDNTEIIYLHNNRNSANACFGQTPIQEQITTYALLNPNGKIHWFWNRLATEHPQL